MVQIENYNKPFLDALAQYDDGRDLSDYDFNQDELGSPHEDDANNRKLAYRHRVIAQKYLQVKLLEQLLVFLYSTFDRPLSCDKEDGKHEGPKGSIGLLFKRGKRKVTARRKKGKIQLAEREKNITEF